MHAKFHNLELIAERFSRAINLFSPSLIIHDKQEFIPQHVLFILYKKKPKTFVWTFRTVLLTWVYLHDENTPDDKQIMFGQLLTQSCLLNTLWLWRSLINNDSENENKYFADFGVVSIFSVFLKLLHGYQKCRFSEMFNEFPPKIVTNPSFCVLNET